jgi:iron complex outermembrane receptor protein
MVRARDLITDTFIIWMPADQYRTALQREFGGKYNPYVAFGFLHVAKQTRVDPEGDFAPPPEAYNLFSVSAGTSLQTDSHLWRIYLEIENLANTSYRDYMNRLRYYADDIGRNISLRAQFQF